MNCKTVICVTTYNPLLRGKLISKSWYNFWRWTLFDVKHLLVLYFLAYLPRCGDWPGPGAPGWEHASHVQGGRRTLPGGPEAGCGCFLGDQRHDVDASWLFLAWWGLLAQDDSSWLIVVLKVSETFIHTLYSWSKALWSSRLVSPRYVWGQTYQGNGLSTARLGFVALAGTRHLYISVHLFSSRFGAQTNLCSVCWTLISCFEYSSGPEILTVFLIPMTGSFGWPGRVLDL